MNQQPMPVHSDPAPKNTTPLIAKIIGILCGVGSFLTFTLMFITDTYDRIAVLSGILMAALAYAIYRQDSIFPALSHRSRLGADHDKVPLSFHLAWTLLGLTLAASLAAWTLCATPILQRIGEMFFHGA